MRPRAAALATAVAAVLALAPALPAHAAVSLNARLLTWGVIGLDSNDVTTGPALFPVGARVCNAGSTAATGLTARFVWDSANAYISVAGPAQQALGTLAAGTCRDAYVNVAVSRTSAAYFATRRFHVTFTASGLTRSTPTRELYVEKLISQNRNQVLGITGPATMVLGESYTIRVESETAPGGYEQVETFLTLPSTVFRIDSVTSTATAGTSPVSQPYLDACGWIDDPADAGYLECAGTGKSGGSMTTTYRVTAVGTGSGTSTTLVYDFSGSSYHYNTDYGVAPNLYSWQVVAPDLALTKGHSPATLPGGGTGTVTLTVRNDGDTATTEPITLVDTLPAGLRYVSAGGGAFTCSASGQRVTCTRTAPLGAGATATVTLTVRATATTATTVTNVATVTTPNDPNDANDRDTDRVPIAAPPPSTTPGGTGTPGATPGSGGTTRPGGGTTPGAGAGQPVPTGPLAQTGTESAAALRVALLVLVAGVLLVEIGIPGPRLVPELIRRRRSGR